MPGSVLNAFRRIRCSVLPNLRIDPLSIPILKIWKLRPEVTGAGWEDGQVALTGDALLQRPQPAPWGWGGGGHSGFKMVADPQGTVGGALLRLTGTPQFLRARGSPRKRSRRTGLH